MLDVSVLGRIFNITPSQTAFLVPGAFGLLPAYAYGLRLILVAGLTALLLVLGRLRTAGKGVHHEARGRQTDARQRAA